MKSSANPDKNENLLQAIGAIVLAVLALSLGDALIKLSSASFSIWQIYVLRSLMAVPILLLVGQFRTADTTWRPQHVWWVTVRSVLLACMWLIYYAALPFVQLPVAAAAFYTLPLFIVLLSRFVIGERVGALGWCAVVLGFAGVAVILRPDARGVNWYALLPIVSALLYACAMILTRTKCRDEDPMALSLGLNLTFIAMGGFGTLLVAMLNWSPFLVQTYPFVFGAWATMGVPEYLIILALGVVIVLGSVFTAIAYQNGPASVVSIFDYAYLAFAVFWGLIIFSDVPDVMSIVGIVMIVVAGIIAVRR